MLSLTTTFYRLGWAALLGSIIGAERTVRRRPAGMRTSVCVTVAAALFTIVSVEIAKASGDTSTTRIASNIVQGVGFLGAGVIVRERGRAVGLRTAAAIFAEAAIGMTAGGGLYAVSGGAALLVLFALVALFYVESLLNLKTRYMLFPIAAGPSHFLCPDGHPLLIKSSINL